MTVAHPDVQARVVSVLAEALGQDAGGIRPHSSLIDDLGAESIDFLDIVFRLESEFGLSIQGDEIWRGSLRADDPQALAEGLRQLRERMPDFDWARFPAEPRKDDLPRLITVRTIVDYVSGRLGGAEGGAPA